LLHTAGEKQCSHRYLQANSDLSDECSPYSSDSAEFSIDIDTASEVDCLQAQVADLTKNNQTAIEI